MDVTAHILEMLGKLGYGLDFPPARRAYDYVLREQEEDGSWFGRWGVNHVYGTCAALMGLEAIGEDMGRPCVRRAVDWLVAHQNDDGGWGESCGSYVDPSLRGVGPSTASQTAWAMLALMSAGGGSHKGCPRHDRKRRGNHKGCPYNGAPEGVAPERAAVEGAGPECAFPEGVALERGAGFLVNTQNDDGTWDEPYFTGTGFPGYRQGEPPRKMPGPGEFGYQDLDMPAGYMINYHMYRNYWPLMALGRYAGQPHQR